ncbi:MAG: hypothetical protein DRQ40_08585, partial [Gammaproteobacteria bacterium]
MRILDKDFCGGQANMLGRDDGALLHGRHQHRSLGQRIGFPEQAAGALVAGKDRIIGERILRCTGQAHMVDQVV